MGKELNFELFVEMLTEKVDAERVALTKNQFLDIQFGTHSLWPAPRILVEIISFLTGLTHDELINRKLEQLVPGSHIGCRCLDEKKVNELDFKEMEDMRLARLNFQRTINFEVMEAYFRTFCIDQSAENDFQLRADEESFNQGLKRWYGDLEVRPLTDLLFNYLSKGMKNHLLTLSEFTYFCRDFMLSPANHQSVVFKIISDCNPDGILKI